jgi:hypothetical protein
MAENYVVKEYLTDVMIDAGAELTQRLLDSGFPISAAFWLWDPEVDDDWRLIFSSPESSMYENWDRIFAARDRMDPKTSALLKGVINQMMPDSELVRAIRTTYPTGDGLVQRRLKRRATNNGQYIHDALLYRAV